MIYENIKIIISFFKLVKGHKIWRILIFLGCISASLLSILIPIFASNIVYYVTISNTNATILNIILLFLTYTFYNFSWYLYYLAYSHNFEYSYKYLRESIVDKVFTYDTDFNDKISKGVILNTVNVDTANLGEMIDSICCIMVKFIKVIILLLIFLHKNILIGLFVIILDFIYVKAIDYCNVKSTKYLMGQYKYRDKLTDNLSQILNGLGEIKLFNIYDKIKHNFYVISNKWQDQYMTKRKYINIRASILPFIVHIGKIGLYIVLAYLVLKGNYKVNTLILLITYFENIMSSTQELMLDSRTLRESSISIKRISDILNYSSVEQIEFGNYENNNIIGLVNFKDVSFTYKSKNKGNIENINFSAEANKITALVGHSGCGKTTIVNLLLRKYKPDTGVILVDNENIYNYSKNSYAKNVIGVNQSPFIFNMSIRKNLSLIDSNFNNQIEACKRVGIHDYIMSLPKKYNTILTENASNFSGGQRQLLSIARTLLSKAEIIVFDEVTSSLDTILVEKIKEIFEDLKQDHTIIFITHKKDVMQIADKIVVINKGKIVGQGTHDELMKDNDYYIDLQTHNYSSSTKIELK